MGQQNQARVFYDIIGKVGASHRYQTIIFVLLILYMYSTGASIFYNVFLFHQNQYTCPSQITNCKDFVCALPAEQRLAYIDPIFSSLISRFGDFRCENYSAKDQAQSIIYIGGVLGTFLSIFLGGFTKWYLVFITGITELLAITVCIFAPTLTIATIALFINFASKAIMLLILPLIMIEIFDQEVRPRNICILFIVMELGSGFNGPLFKFLPWQFVLVLENIIPVSIAMLLTYLFMEQTPFDLILNYAPEESQKALQRISKINNIPFDASITVAELANIKRQYEQNNSKHQVQQLSFIDLFRYKSLRGSVLIGICLSFFLGYQFDASELSLANYSIEIYFSGTILGFAGIIGAIICFIIMDSYDRKTIFYVSQGLCFLSAMAVFILAPCNNQQVCEANKLIIQGVGLWIFRLFNAIYLTVYYVFITEVFPTQVRLQGLVITTLSYNVGIVIIPVVESWLKTAKLSITIIFAVMSLLIILSMIPLKQTRGIPPQDIIEELQYKHQALNPKQVL